ncbi:nitrilase-related carbon-nitrogen hydrolase [Naasia sp. SYSU D00057]|uniref:nitrilase-related carbon-nitrogen hydrolase n=1 Tax=Naasia sp. SYSU D00057 TaxID=2817380 RepID=UPI001B3158B9|nr:nitrilase-related carbon-nitrogen hydrolase [Naasia sp. SYSU D00057]
MTAPASTAVVALQQIAPWVGRNDENRRRVARAIADAAAAGANVIVLPELATSGYMFESVDEVRAAALPADSPLLAEWAELLAGTTAVAVVGFAELAEDGRLFNSAAVLDASGVRAVYRKTHLWNREKLFFTPGDELPPVVDTEAGRVGVLVCYDLEFPEMVRHLAVEGADLVAVPTNWPRVPKVTGDLFPEVMIGMANARVNKVAIAVCDRAGRERGQEWNQGSAVIDQYGNVVAQRTDAGLLTVPVDLTVSRDKTLTEHADALGDRRLDLYGGDAAKEGDR